MPCAPPRQDDTGRFGGLRVAPPLQGRFSAAAGAFPLFGPFRGFPSLSAITPLPPCCTPAELPTRLTGNRAGGTGCTGSFSSRPSVSVNTNSRPVPQHWAKSRVAPQYIPHHSSPPTTPSVPNRHPSGRGCPRWSWAVLVKQLGTGRGWVGWAGTGSEVGAGEEVRGGVGDGVGYGMRYGVGFGIWGGVWD